MQSDDLIGRTIAGRFHVEAFVGAGAMGRVYRARQVALGTTVAVKVLHSDLSRDRHFAARFLREAQAASRIDHPSSIRVFDFGEDEGLLYIAMELVTGKSLAEIVDEGGPLPAERIVAIASQVLAALAVAHDMGVIHRDLKPENILLVERDGDDGDKRSIAKVCDFGIAKLLETSPEGSRVTAEGAVIGTPAFMSPEQARGDRLDPRSDLYSVGVLLFHLMTGKVPFEASSPFGTALMHVTDEPTRPRLLAPDIDDRLEAICLKAMSKKPEDRYASARELRAALRALVDGEHTTAPRRVGGMLDQVQAAPRRGGYVMALAVIATVGAGAWIWRGSSHPNGDHAEPGPRTTEISAASVPKPVAAAAPAAAPSVPIEPKAEPVVEPAPPPPMPVAAPVAHGRRTPKRANVTRPALGKDAKDAKDAVAPATAPPPLPAAAPPAAPAPAPAPSPKAHAAPVDEPLPDFPIPPPEAPKE